MGDLDALKNGSVIVQDTGWINGSDLRITGSMLHLRRLGGLVMIRYIFVPMMGNSLQFDISEGTGKSNYVDIIDFSQDPVLNGCFGSGLLEGSHCIGDSFFAEVRLESKNTIISLYMKNLALSVGKGVNPGRVAFCLCVPTAGSFPKACATNLGGTALSEYLIQTEENYGIRN